MRRFWNWLWDPNGYGLLGMLAIFLAVCVPILIVVTWAEENPTPAPVGCVWIDMNPSKSYDPHLACVEGYGWDK